MNTRAKRGTHYTENLYTGTPGCSTHSHAFVACRMALWFPNTPPTVAQLMHQFGMSRATAYRWRRAMLDARLDLQSKAAA